MKSNIKKGQIVVVTKSTHGSNFPGTITKVVNAKILPGDKLDDVIADRFGDPIRFQDRVKFFCSVLCEDKTDRSRRRYCNKPVFEEYYIRPATTHEKKAYKKGYFNPERKAFSELEINDTLMLKKETTKSIIMVEAEVVGTYSPEVNSNVVSVALVPVKVNINNAAINDLDIENIDFIEETSVVLDSLPPKYK